MNFYQKMFVFLFRIALGWLMFYAGLKQVLNSQFSAGGYLSGAKTFHGFYKLLAGPAMLPIINFVNEWALVLLGVALIFGIFLRLAGILGAVLMLLYYFPVLDFPHIGQNSYIVDEHIIYALALLLLAGLRADKIWGLGKLLRK